MSNAVRELLFIGITGINSSLLNSVISLRFSMTRVISKPAPDTLCLDLGHKSIASENPLDRRVHFLNAPDTSAGWTQ